LASIDVPSHFEIHQIAYVTMHGWSLNSWSDGWTKEGQTIKDCHFQDYCDGCTECFDRIEFTLSEAYDVQSKTKDSDQSLEE